MMLTENSLKRQVHILKRYDGFVTEEHIRRVSERKRLKKTYSVEGKLRRVFLPFVIKTKKGSYRVQRALLEDSEDKQYLVMFWENVGRLDKIKIGDVIKLEHLKYNARYDEYYAGRKTQITVIRRAPVTELSELHKLEDGTRVTTRGKIVEIYPEYYYMYGNVERKMFAFKIMEGLNWFRVVVWHSPINMNQLKEGMVVRVENAVLHKPEEIHINLASRIVIEDTGETNVHKDV